jgi:hypothetical protein
MTGQTNRPRALATLTVAVAFALSSAAAIAPRTAHAYPDQTPINELADAFLIDKGQWFCGPGQPPDPVSPGVVCPNLTSSPQFARTLIQHLVANPQDTPQLMRVAKARNDCIDKPNGQGWTSCETGLPPAATCPTPPGTFSDAQPYCALKDLDDRGVGLGVIVGADTDQAGPDTRGAKEIAFQACEIRKADDAGLFHFMFLDQAFKLPQAQLELAVAKVVRGQRFEFSTQTWVPCQAGGWPRLITNDTTWKPGDGSASLDTDAWGHARHLQLLEGSGWRQEAERAANQESVPALKQADTDFARAVHRVDAQPVLRFEVTSQSSKFASLGGGDQCQLLKEWARPQQAQDYAFTYPFYVHGLTPEHVNPYESGKEGTFEFQLGLVDAYAPDDPVIALPPCPA